MIKKLLNSAIILKLFVIISVTLFAHCQDRLIVLYDEKAKFDPWLNSWQLEVTTTAPSQNMTFQMVGTVDLTIDWGDDIEETTTLTSITHTYAEIGVYVLKIRGNASRIYFYNPDAQARLTGFLSPLRGVDGINSFQDTFYGCINITTPIPTGFFDYNSNVTTFRRVFADSGITGTIPGDLFANNSLAQDFNGVFWNCTGLTGSIPAGLFANNSQAIDFTYTFRGCSGLTGALPASLFANCPNASVFQQTFVGCSNLTGAIPAGFFDNNSQAQTFLGAFSGCTGITSIPADLFDNNTMALDFVRTFSGCTSITSIPAGLFDNIQATAFTGTFQNCTGITSIPAGLFDNNTLVTNFGGTFSGCTGITSIPADLFDNNTLVTNFEYTFFNCTGITSAVPPLWTTHASALHTDCFNNVINASNYADVVANGWN